MKKNFLRIMAVAVFSLVIIFALAGCGLSDEEREIVGLYELTEVSVSGQPSINVNTYDYFTMEFKSNKKCTVKSKVGINTYEASAKWKVNSDGEVEVITQQGFAKATEIYKYEDGVLSGSNSGPIEGTVYTVTMKLKKVVVETPEE